MKVLIQQKDEEIAKIKRNIKSTKLNEFEVEVKLYIDECTRLKHLLDEIVRSKDPISNPETQAEI